MSSILSGIVTQKIGYYVPSMLAAPTIMCVGEGLLSTLHRDSPQQHWAAYQFLSGFGLGFGMQTSGLAIQTVLPKEDVSIGIAINFFVQQLGGAVFTSVGQAILTNLLVARLAPIPGFNPKAIVSEGATHLSAIAPPEFHGAVVDAYNHACRHIFLASMGLAFASLFSALGMEWRSIKKGKYQPPGSAAPEGSGPPSPVTAAAMGPEGMNPPPSPAAPPGYDDDVDGPGWDRDPDPDVKPTGGKKWRGKRKWALDRKGDYGPPPSPGMDSPGPTAGKPFFEGIRRH